MAAREIYSSSPPPPRSFTRAIFRAVLVERPGWRGGGGWGAAGTPIHYLYGYVPPNGVVILKLLIYNGVSISEAFSRTGYNISNARKLQFCKEPFEIIQGQIAFKIRSCCTLCFSVQGGRILARAASADSAIFDE